MELAALLLWTLVGKREFPLCRRLWEALGHGQLQRQAVRLMEAGGIFSTRDFYGYDGAMAHAVAATPGRSLPFAWGR
eukprot:7213165-Alexandrium_andersonii.AAC.1